MSGPVPEPEVVTPTSRQVWIALLAGPSVWFGHFVAVYLLAEVACAAAVLGAGWWGLTALGWVILAATVLALATVAVAAWKTYTYWRDGRSSVGLLLVVGLGLDALFAVAIIATAVPVALLRPC